MILGDREACISTLIPSLPRQHLSHNNSHRMENRADEPSAAET